MQFTGCGCMLFNTYTLAGLRLLLTAGKPNAQPKEHIAPCDMG